MESHSITRRLVPGILFGFLVLLALALLADLRQVGDRFQEFNWLVFPLVLGLTLFNYTLRFGKWHYYLRLIGIQQLPVRESARIFVAGFPLAVTPGKVGELIKAVWLNHKTALPVARGVSVVLAERISDGLAVLLLSLIGVIAYPQYWPAFLFIFLSLAAVILIVQIRPLALWLIGLGERLPLVARFAVALREFYEGAYLLFRPAPTAVAVSLGMVSWFGEGLGFYLILLGLGVPPSAQTLATAVFILSFSIVLGAVTALPGGLGVAEASIAGMLVLLLGLSPDTAAAATLLIRFATLWFGVGLGLAVWAFSPELLGLTRQPFHTEVP
jgi:uncharacterized protein (TIRG00374 family)